MKLDEDTFKAAKSLRDRLQNLLEKSDSEDGEPDTSFKDKIMRSYFGGNGRPDSLMLLLKLDNAFCMISGAQQPPHWDAEPTDEMIAQEQKFVDETEAAAQEALDEIIAAFVDWATLPYNGPGSGPYKDYAPRFTNLVLKSHKTGKASEMFAYRKLLNISLDEALKLFKTTCPLVLANIESYPEDALEYMYNQAKEFGLDVDLQ